jgi:hypothetical protein
MTEGTGRGHLINVDDGKQTLPGKIRFSEAIGTTHSAKICLMFAIIGSLRTASFGFGVTNPSEITFRMRRDTGTTHFLTGPI